MRKNKIEKVDDDMLIDAIDRNIRNASGGYTGSSDASKRRENSIYEMCLEPKGDLVPQGVSKIVSSDSAEVAEGYTALLTKLLLDNNKLALFTPYSNEVAHVKASQIASDVVNYCLFNSNPDGWTKLETWIKSAVVFGNSALTWGWEENFDYEVEEYDTIQEAVLDQILADSNVEIVGDLQLQDEEFFNPEDRNAITYENVRLRRKIDKSGVKITNIPPESFLIDKGAESITEAKFVGLVTDMTHSDIRRNWPDFNGDLSEMGEEASFRDSEWSLESYARKQSAGQDNWINSDDEEDEANISITVVECWIRSDRDGDGIAELKHVIKAGNTILEEEDSSYIPIAMLNPVEIPHEFYGLSLLDMARPQTQATTAIMRGFVENVYFGNYGRTLADPNVVDFAALQNPLPKQIIATNGSPANAIQQITPEQVSPGTGAMLEFLGLQKEQSTGLTKTAMGLNDTLFVSGNSEQKMGNAQNSAQIRVEHIGRRFVESGIKDLCRGVLKEMRTNLKNPMRYKTDKGYASLTTEELQMMPANMDLEIQANLGENSNTNMSMKLNQMAELLPMMASDPEAAAYINPQAAFNLATDIVANMGLDPTRYLVDPANEESQQQIQKKQQEANNIAETVKQNEMERARIENDTAIANISFIKAEVDNKKIDNKRQLLEAEDESNRKWAEIVIKAEGTEGARVPNVSPVSFRELYQDTDQDEKEEAKIQQQGEQLAQAAIENPEQAMQMAEQAGLDPSAMMGGQQQ
jgi:hypothetical protein